MTQSLGDVIVSILSFSAADRHFDIWWSNKRP